MLDVQFSLLFIGPTLLLATLSFYWVETPLRAHRPRLKQAVGYSVLVCAVLGAVPSTAKINQTLSPPPLPAEYLRYADPATICHGQIVGDYLKGDLNSDKEVLVLGDSHAAMLNLFFDQLGKELGFKARIITASSCVTIPEFDYQRIAEWAHKPCLAQIEQVKQYLPQAKVTFLAGMWSWQIQSGEFQRVIGDFLENGAPHAQKYVMSQVPSFKKNPMRNRRFGALGIGSAAGRDESCFSANRVLEKISHAYRDTSYLELDKLQFFGNAPIYKGALTYYDESHMNESGVLEYAEQAKSLLNSALRLNPEFRAAE